MDIKPGNILYNTWNKGKENESYEIKLADFGISKLSTNTVTNTSARGTTYYMSPELLEISNGLGTGEFSPELSDIFSLGISFIRISL